MAQHAAVTVDSGWTVHKPSQGWFDPVQVLSTSDVKSSTRRRGHRMQRYTLKIR
jgi:hypothetical protein